MRSKEFIAEEVVKAEVDWQQFKSAMAASAIQRNVPRGLDAVVYLGIIGDPSNTSIELRFKRPVQIGMDVSPKGQGYVPLGAQASYHSSDNQFKNINGEEGQTVGKDFDILFNFQGEPIERQNWATFQNALSNTIAHELMHRGFAIIDRISAIKEKIPEPSRSYFDQRWSNNIPGLFNAEDRKSMTFRPVQSDLCYLEHMIIYAILTEKDSMGNDKWTEEVLKFRKIYMDIESAAQQYVLSYPIPTGSLAELRSEIDRKTPDNVKVNVKITNNIPTVTLTPKIKDIVNKFKTDVGQGIDSIKAVVAPASRPSAISKSASDAWDAAKTGVSNVAAKTAKLATDTISTISNTAGGQTLKQLNPQIKDVNRIQVGQKIKLPNGSTYVVKQGDTLDKIAARYSSKEDMLSKIKRLAGL